MAHESAGGMAPFEQWQDDIAAVTNLANPDSVPQQVLDSVRSLSV